MQLFYGNIYGDPFSIFAAPYMVQGSGENHSQFNRSGSIHGAAAIGKSFTIQ
jgi:hypothetical protein